MGSNLKAIRELRNMSQAYVAKKINVDQAQVSRMESGKSKISEQKRNALSELLQVDAEVISDDNQIIIINRAENTVDGKHGCYLVENTFDGQHNLYLEVLKAKDELLAMQAKQIASLEQVLKELSKSSR
jgi:transcriptional regulator with XRE-family HTH domain